MKTTEYNGWTNYETWNVKLWIDNDEGSYNRWKEQAQETFDNAKDEKLFTKKERAALSLSEELKGFIEENNPLAGDASLYCDILTANLQEVNWHEIANSLLEEIQETDFSRVFAEHRCRLCDDRQI